MKAYQRIKRRHSRRELARHAFGLAVVFGLPVAAVVVLVVVRGISVVSLIAAL